MGFDITLETDKLPKPDIKSNASNLENAVNKAKIANSADGTPFGASVVDTVQNGIQEADCDPVNKPSDESNRGTYATPPITQKASNKLFGQKPVTEADDMENKETEKDLESTWEHPNKTEEAKAVIEAAIAKAPDVVCALESLAHIYHIPEDHVMGDNSLKSIKVHEDFIIAPENTNVQGNKDNIIRAMATLLDNIGLRVDNALDQYQTDCIAKNKEFEVAPEETPSFAAVPSKVYINDQEEPKPQEFGSDNEPPENPEPQAFGPDEQQANEYVEYLYDLYGTPYIGTASFSEMGYNVEKHDYVQESATPASNIKPEDIKYMRFDNSGIVKAIKCFNEVRAEQSDVKEDGALSYQKIIKNPKFKEGINALAEQFDCRIRLTLENNDEMTGYTMTDRMSNPKHKVTISKKSGFKLNGFTIYICISTGLLQFASPKDEKNFGQMLTSILLHEIFHNITTLLMWDNAAWIGSYMATITRAIQTKSPKVKKILIQKYIENMENVSGHKMNKIKKLTLQKQLFALCSAKQIQRAFDSAKGLKKRFESSTVAGGEGSNSADASAEILIDNLNKIIPDLKDQYRTKPGKVADAIIHWALWIIVSVAGSFAYAMGSITLGPVLLFSVLGFFTSSLKTLDAAFPAMLRKMAEQFKSGKDLEEQFADAFAAMYKLPVIFHFVPTEDYQSKFKYNELSRGNLDQLAKLFKEYGTLIMDVHPTDYQRASQAIKAAKQILADGGKFIDPTQKRYLEWLVNGFDSIEDTSVDDVVLGESPVFDPNATADLNKHLENLIQHGRKNINITESVNFNDLMDKRDIVIQEHLSIQSDFWDNNSTYGQRFIGKPVTDEEIKSVENELGVQLPMAYKELIKQQNGGMVNRCIFPCGYKTGWSNDHIEITDILGIDKNKPSIFGTEYLQSEWGYPEGYLNIANTPVSGHLEVFLDYREAGPNADPPVVSIDQEDNYKVTFLAKSFEIFVNSLITKDEFEEQRKRNNGGETI